jgi:hypothetical protein
MDFQDALIKTLLGICIILLLALLIFCLVFEPLVIVFGVAGLLFILLIAYAVMRIYNHK